jgi:hypothetical protein
MQPGSRILSNDSIGNTATLVQKGAMQVTGMLAMNTTAAAAFVQYFDAAAATDVTVGTTTPFWVIRSPASSISDGDGLPTHGLVFTKGVVIASTTTPTGNSGATQHVRTALT